MDYIRDTRIYKDFLASNIEVAKYIKICMFPPADIYNRYKECLSAYQYFLDRIGRKMPLEKYPYDPRDKKTWKYLDHEIGKGKNNSFNCKAILNHDWKYKEIR